MQRKVLVAIATYKRANLYPASGIFRYLPYIPENFHVNLFIKNLPSEIDSYGSIPYEQCAIDYNYLSELRQTIIKYAIDNTYSHLILIDDDVSFAFKDINRYSLCPMANNVSMIDLMFKDLVHYCGAQVYPITHPHIRFGSHENLDTFLLNRKAIRCVCYSVPVLSYLELDTDPVLFDIKNMSDYYIQLKVLEKGYKSLCLNSYTVDDNGTGTVGGCSEYRTPELQTTSAEILSATFRHVKLRKKESGYFDKPYYDVTINWSKYLKESK